jgi:hypothetical protein
LLKGEFFHDFFLGGFEQGIKAAQDHHRQDHVAVLAADIDIAEAVVGNGPNKGYEAVVDGLIHVFSITAVSHFGPTCFFAQATKILQFSARIAEDHAENLLGMVLTVRSRLPPQPGQAIRQAEQPPEILHPTFRKSQP